MIPETDVRTHLITQSVIASSAIFIGGARRAGNGIPHKAVFVSQNGGYPPSEYMGGVSTTYYARTVQVRVRGDVNDYAAGLTLANAAHNALQRATISGYVRVTCNQSAPMYMGFDEVEHPEWSFDCTLESKG